MDALSDVFLIKTQVPLELSNWKGLAVHVSGDEVSTLPVVRCAQAVEFVVCRKCGGESSTVDVTPNATATYVQTSDNQAGDARAHLTFTEVEPPQILWFILVSRPQHGPVAEGEDYRLVWREGLRIDLRGLRPGARWLDELHTHGVGVHHPHIVDGLVPRTADPSSQLPLGGRAAKPVILSLMQPLSPDRLSTPGNVRSPSNRTIQSRF